MAGYDGYSKSNNASEAEENGRYPMTHAARIVAAKSGITQAKAKWLLTAINDGEWHHSSKYYNAVQYYDTGAAIWIVKFADRLGFPLDDLFVNTCIAYGLHDTDDQEDYDSDDPIGFDNDSEAEFVADLKAGRWLS